MNKPKLAVFVVCCAILAEPAEAASRHRRVHASPHYTHRLVRGCPTHRAVDGSLVDCQGWRLWTNGWDPSCHNLDYLPSQFACGARGGY